jgi:anti-sigma regulatory factor (Ser/Thr protein kinase)
LPRGFKAQFRRYRLQRAAGDITAKNPEKNLMMPEDVRRQCDAIRDEISAAVRECCISGKAPDEHINRMIQQIERILLEVVPNIFQHAHQGDPNKRAMIEWQMEDSVLHMHAHDSGNGFDLEKVVRDFFDETKRIEEYQQLLEQEVTNDIPELKLTEGGRGIVLIQKYGGDVRWDPAVNHASFCLRRDVYNLKIRDDQEIPYEEFVFIPGDCSRIPREL